MTTAHPWRCEFCGARFRTRAELRIHRQQAHSAGICQVCDRHVYGTATEFATHLESHGRSLENRTKLTKRNLPSVSDRDSQKKVHRWDWWSLSHLKLWGKKKDEGFSRFIAEKVSDEVPRTTKDIRKLRCRKCKVPLQFETHEMWNRHAFQCNGLKEIKCTFCDWVTFSKIAMDTHLFIKHNGGQIKTRGQRRIPAVERTESDFGGENEEEDDSPSCFDIIEFS